ncbi:dihydrofolate reductase family protein [Myroides sp. C15-4]|uniref:dihydrofolate reductase family protein n=1 Tax=Myroides sp. C15-4 TaxID=3400532 RepID=UPI003D2F52AC
MKVTVIANISINGKVLVSDNPAHQLPKEAMDFYLNYAHRVGNLIIGMKTFEHFQHFPQVVKDRFMGIELVVLSTHTDKKETTGYRVVSSPEEAIAHFMAKGVSEIAIGGGTGTFNAFIDKELATDLYLNINPILTGHGGYLVQENKLHTTFELVAQHLNNGFIQLHLTKV